MDGVTSGHRSPPNGELLIEPYIHAKKYAQ